MTALKILGYTLGFSGTGWLFYLNIGGWKGDIIWVLMGTWWIVQVFRAVMKLYWENVEKRIEMREKQARYDKDIFT